MKPKEPVKNKGTKVPPELLVGVASGLNLVVHIARFEVAATKVFEPPTVGLPIMREGFVTETGFLDSSEVAGHQIC